jgi:RNA polymerase sigma-70 factor (ECF subfamily)
MGMHDSELMARWRQGDAGGFEALVARWQGPVARFLGRFTGRPEAVADLCQEVFLRLYHAGPRYRESGAFSAWLYRIAVNVARDAGRRGRRAPEPLADREPLDRADPAEAVCRRQELADHLRRAVADLPEPLRLVLVLRHDEGLNFEEIGRLTGTPASTLKTRFAVALQRLRAVLERLGYGPEEMTP